MSSAAMQVAHPDLRALLQSPPPAAPPALLAAQLRLAWSGLCHVRLGSGCLLEFVSVDVVARVGDFVRLADVYRARVRQAQLIHELRASTPVGSDDVARASRPRRRPSVGCNCCLQ